MTQFGPNRSFFPSPSTWSCVERVKPLPVGPVPVFARLTRGRDPTALTVPGNEQKKKGGFTHARDRRPRRTATV